MTPFHDMFIDVDHPDFTHPKNMIEMIQNHILKSHQHQPASIGEISRIIYESMVKKYQEILAELEKCTHKQIRILHIIGGGSQNHFLNQLIANRLQIPVIAGPVEATAIGNVLMQAMSRNEIESHYDLRQIVRNSFDVKEFLPEINQGLELIKFFEQLRKHGADFLIFSNLVHPPIFGVTF